MTPKKQILVVEDNVLNRELLVAILENDYDTLQAENGLEALDILQKHKGEIALILLDVMMPVMDGFTFLDKIKQDEELSLIPVIVTTQSDGEADEVAALARGATDFVPKPYKPQVILHRIASIIKLRETAAMVNQFQYDRLTGLFSREFFLQKARTVLDENPDVNYTIVCSNIENFKLYNDTYGRQGGDNLLKKIAEMIREIVGDNGVYGRYGADRFIVMQESNAEKEFRNNFFVRTEGTLVYKKENLSMKWGIYEITDRSISVEQMCDRALLASDSIKGQYNKPFAVYDDTMREKILREKTLTDAMETALAENQFVVYLQPKYSIGEECMIGAEALVRWIHPQWGFMSPAEFIPLFEKNGFIFRLDQFVWEQVCKAIADWQQKGIAPLPVSVNVSRADTFNTQITSTLLDITQKHGVSPELLHLEITESAFTDNPQTLVDTVNQLRKAGFIIEMDDFGSGYSSLNMLSKMQLDVLKLDRLFIQNEMEKPAYQSILKDIVNMAHRMHLRVVAEGVETREQMKRLQTVGCDLVQGYFFAKPMPVADFEKMLKEHRQKTQNAQPKQQKSLGLRTLLIVDNDEKFLKKARNTFEGQYHVVEAADAQSALEFVEKHGRDDLSAVILSASLPNNQAETVLNFLNQDASLWKIPVLATMAAGDRQQCLSVARAADDFLCKLHPVFDLKKRVQHLVDAAESHQRERVLLDEACRDYITGLLNRRGLQASVNALRTEDLPLAVCLFDLDNLKMVNDTSGHEVGDKIIQTFADLLRRQTRAEDIQCRYGGDEFVVVLKRINNPETAVKIGENVCQTFQKTLEEEQIASSCSCGVATGKEIDMPFGKLLEQADQALYVAKRENKGSCRLWEK